MTRNQPIFGHFQGYFGHFEQVFCGIFSAVNGRIRMGMSGYARILNPNFTVFPSVSQYFLTVFLSVFTLFSHSFTTVKDSHLSRYVCVGSTQTPTAGYLLYIGHILQRGIWPVQTNVAYKLFYLAILRTVLSYRFYILQYCWVVYLSVRSLHSYSQYRRSSLALEQSVSVLVIVSYPIL